MPPKRKAPAAKNSIVDEVVQNGSEPTDPPKAKRGKAPKPVEKTIEEPKTTRSTRAQAAALAVVERQVVEEESKKKKKGKGKAAEEKVPESNIGKKAPAAKKGTNAKKKETKFDEAATAKKKAPASTAKNSTKATKAKSTRVAKKGDEKIEKPTTTKAEVSKKKPDRSESEDESQAKKSRGKSKGEPLLNQTDTDFSAIDFTCSKQNALGMLPNFKISSWNVDGIRAWLKKKGLEYVEYEQPDILCLQEIKCSKDNIPDEFNKFMDYKTYWCPSDKRGYAGVAVFSKRDPLSLEYGVGNEEFDADGRCITLEYAEFYLVNVYVPNAGRKLVTLPQRLEWNAIFKDYVLKLDEKKPVIVCGDMNVAHNEIDLANPKTNRRNAGFTQEERDGFTDFLDDKYIDTYRNLYPDQQNAYTFWTYMMKARAKNVGWRLDYFIVSKRFMDHICDNVIRTNVYGSDHCPITLLLNV